MFPLLVLFAAITVWLTYGGPKVGFLPDFAKLLDRPEFVNDVRNRLSGRAFLTGEFRGRKVVILLQHGKKGRANVLVVSMEADVATTIESYEFKGDRADREGELALFALEAKHELRLRLQDGCLKALWQPLNLMFFPGAFDPGKWRSVLEAMHSLVGSLERRAALVARGASPPEPLRSLGVDLPCVQRPASSPETTASRTQCLPPPG